MTSASTSAPLAPVVFLLTPSRVRSTLFQIMGALVVLNALAISLRFVFDAESWSVRHLAVYFDVGRERNVPTLFSTFLLGLAAYLLIRLGRQATGTHRFQKPFWYLLGAAFLFLALDEAFQFHEQLTAQTHTVLTAEHGGFLHNAWVLPYLALLTLGGVLCLRFFRSLPVPIRTRFVVAVVLFVSGAVGLEVVEGYFYTRYGPGNAYSALLYTLEEFLEMSGVIVFIHALLLHLLGPDQEVRVQVRVRGEAL